MQKIALLGNIGQDATIRQAGSDTVISFSLACSIKLKDGNIKTTWYNCSIWNKDKLAEHLKKGTKVLLEGTPGIHLYDDKNGVKQATIQVSVKEIYFAGSAKTSETSPSPVPTTPETHPAMNSTIPPVNPENTEEDLPF